MSEAGDRWRREHPERVKEYHRKYAEAHRGDRPKPKARTCSVCGAPFSHAWRKTCSEKCESASASLAMARTNRKHASARMKTHNPMHRGDACERMTATLKRIGHRPPVQGGNGHVIPDPVLRLLPLLTGFSVEVAIPTGRPRGSGYPTSYKVDLGNAERKVAIEVDGKSHGLLSRKEQDRKKDVLLGSLGWTVIRFTNEEVMADPLACARATQW